MKLTIKRGIKNGHNVFEVYYKDKPFHANTDDFYKYLGLGKYDSITLFNFGETFEIVYGDYKKDLKVPLHRTMNKEQFTQAVHKRIQAAKDFIYFLNYEETYDIEI